MFFHRRFGFLWHPGDKVFVERNGVFSQYIHNLVAVGIQEATVVLTVIHIKHPVHGFDFPVVSDKVKYALRRSVQATDVIYGY